jgi:hypothetical protein
MSIGYCVHIKHIYKYRVNSTTHAQPLQSRLSERDRGYREGRKGLRPREEKRNEEEKRNKQTISEMDTMHEKVHEQREKKK